MSEAVSSRKARQSYLRETQQEGARRKKELALQQREDMKALKAYYAEEAAKVDDDSTAAVNHIKEEDQADRQAAHDEKLATKATYDRSGKASGGQAMAAQKPAVQNYITKDTDNFYKVQDRGSRVSESSKGYYIDAYAPDHEKDQIRVSIQNDKAVISGKRKFQDSVDQGNKKISTNNFQTFREEFAFERPVAAEGITRERSGDYIRFFIPKMETASFDKGKKS